MSDLYNTMSHTFQTIREYAATLWFDNQDNCILCGSISADSVCPNCKETYFQAVLPRCISCGKIIPLQKVVCKGCEAGNGPKGLTKVTALGYYNGALKAYIQNVKFKGQPYLLFPLAKHFVSWTIDTLPPPDAVLPVPMHPSRLALRGYNQAEVLASILSRQLGIRYQDMLQRNKETISQTALGRRERLLNLQGAFIMMPKLKKNIQDVWLVDDVVTTGSTLEECARVLKTGGIRNVYAVCLGTGKEE